MDEKSNKTFEETKISKSIKQNKLKLKHQLGEGHIRRRNILQPKNKQISDKIVSQIFNNSQYDNQDPRKIEKCKMFNNILKFHEKMVHKERHPNENFRYTSNYQAYKVQTVIREVIHLPEIPEEGNQFENEDQTEEKKF